MTIDIISKSSNIPFLTLDELKSEKRIESSFDDSILQRAIEASVDFFENNTSYYLREVTFELGLNYTDNVFSYYNSRGIDTFYDDYNTSYDLTRKDHPTYNIPLGKVSNKNFTELSLLFLRDNSQLTLNEDELNAFNNSNSVLITRKNPLQLSIDFEVYLRNIIGTRSLQQLRLRGNLRTDAITIIPYDIKQCLLRIASRLHEYPDDDINLLSDEYISNTIAKYKIDYRL